MRTGARILVAGGYGVFGRLLAHELLETTDAHLVLAGRDRRQGERAAAELGTDRIQAIELDLHDVESVARAVEGCFAIACTAGPFQGSLVSFRSQLCRLGPTGSTSPTIRNGSCRSSGTRT